MKSSLVIKIIGIILVLLVFVLIYKDRAISIISSSRVDFDHVEKTGGLHLGDPNFKNNKYYIHIECDAIGKFISNKPKVINSAPLSYYKAIVKQKGNIIHFYLKVRLDKDYKETKIKEIELGKIRTGIYKVYYLNRDGSEVYIKEIVVK